MKRDNAIEFIGAAFITGAVAIIVWGVASVVTLHLCSWQFFLGTWVIIGVGAGIHYCRRPRKWTAIKMSDPELEKALMIDETSE